MQFSQLHFDQQGSRLLWLAAGAAIVAGSAWTIRDKHNWVAFGTGGTKPTWFGYLRNNFVLRTLVALGFDNPRDAKRLDLNAEPAYLRGKLSKRKRERPSNTGWTLPQRQIPGAIDPDAREQLWKLTEKYATAHPDILELKLSETEGRTTMGIYARPDLSGRPASASDRTLGNEIAHVHPEDNSLHVWLSEADCAEVVSKGWGEKFGLFPLKIVHPGFAFVYAPEQVEDIAVIEKIVEAGISYVSGKKI